MNKKLFVFGSSSSPVSLFCKNVGETIHYLFYECNIAKELWKNLISIFDKCLTLRYLHHRLPFLVSAISTVMIYFLKTISYYYPKSRKHEKISLQNLIRNVTKVKNIEKEIGNYWKQWKKRLCCITKSGK